MKITFPELLMYIFYPVVCFARFSEYSPLAPETAKEFRKIGWIGLFGFVAYLLVMKFRDELKSAVGIVGFAIAVAATMIVYTTYMLRFRKKNWEVINDPISFP